jgi:hypothetical protein
VAVSDGQGLGCRPQVSHTDGDIGFNNGEFPLSHCVLGAEQLHKGDSYIASLKTPDQVAVIATALRPIDKTEFRERYVWLDSKKCGYEIDENDFEYSWNWFDGLADFYAKAAAAHRHVLFTADQ